MITDPILSSLLYYHFAKPHSSKRRFTEGSFNAVQFNLCCLGRRDPDLASCSTFVAIKLVSDESGHDINPSHRAFREALLEHLGKKVTKVSPPSVYQFIPATEVSFVSGATVFLEHSSCNL